MRNFLRDISRFFIRISAFVRKEIFEILRQTRLVVTLILGPFLILLLFGVGYRDEPRALRTLFVVPEGSGLGAEIEEFMSSLVDSRIEFMGITTDAEEADAALRRQALDLVVVAPADPMGTILANEQAAFKLFHYEIDPFEKTYVEVVGSVYVNELNRRVLELAVEQGKQEASLLQEDVTTARQTATSLRQALQQGDGEEAQQHQQDLNEDIGLLTIAAGSSLAIFNELQEQFGLSQVESVNSLVETINSIQETLGLLDTINPSQGNYTAELETVETVEDRLETLDGMLGAFRNIDSYVIVNPFISETASITNVALQPTHFYAPGVIALLLQHVAVTIAALSFIRERLAGTMELFRVSPVSSTEMLFGKYVSYLLLAGALAAILTALVVFVLGVPMLGSWASYITAVAVLLLASLGIGFGISLVARTDSQAVQYAMIVLLGSVFFSGFFLALYRLWEPVRLISWLLPTTYGTILLQSIMLRGQDANDALLFALFVIGVVLFLYAWLRLRLLLRRESL